LRLQLSGHYKSHESEWITAEKNSSEGCSVWANEGLEKIVRLKTIFKNHINTIRVLSNEIPETSQLQPETREVCTN
jgi:hypothetical protein